jgi:hypothetical protein
MDEKLEISWHARNLTLRRVQPPFRFPVRCIFAPDSLVVIGRKDGQGESLVFGNRHCTDLFA